MPEHHCKLLKPLKPNGVYQFPRSLNLEGPPGQSGNLLIMCSSGEDGSAGGGGAAAGGGGSGSGSGGVADDTRVLRLPVSIKAGEPAKVLIRSLKLGVEEFADVIRATQLANFKVSKSKSGRRNAKRQCRIVVVCPPPATGRASWSNQCCCLYWHFGAGRRHYDARMPSGC